MMNYQYTSKFVFDTFKDIDQGRYHNAHFSHANVVMVSKEHYAELIDACTFDNTGKVLSENT